jgi:fumarylacetoacetate (FAA) hydrolase
MKLATLKNGKADGQLVVVSRDLSCAAPADHITPSLRSAIEDWGGVEAKLKALSRQVSAGIAPGLTSLSFDALDAPLPRAWQWLDGSVYSAHVELATKAYDLPDVWYDHPLMYQGMSHRFLPPEGDVFFPREEDGIDFEGEFAVVTGAIQMGADRVTAAGSILLVAQLNDWSLRVSGREEMRRGYGWIHAKPACTMAPVVVTPDELGSDWQDSRCSLDLNIYWNDQLFGRANGVEMAFGFDELIAHAAYSRDLPAGTVIGSGTVANAAFRDVGSSCILERRAIETLDKVPTLTRFLEDGDRVMMVASAGDGDQPFGAMHSTVRIQSPRS